MADSILNTIGLSVVDTGIQLLQLGTLTDPFSLPNHEAHYVTLQIWATDPETGQRTVPLMTHTFTVMPQQMTVLKQYLSKVINTPGGAFVDDFHMGDSNVIAPYPITFSGNFGKRARVFNVDRLIKFDGSIDQIQRLLGGVFSNNPSALPLDIVTGYGQTKFLERLCDLSHMHLGKLIEQAQQDYLLARRLAFYPDIARMGPNVTTEVVLYNWSFHQFVVVNINNVRFMRNARLNCWTYQLNMIALGSAIPPGPTFVTESANALSMLFRGAVQSIGSATVDAATQLVNAPIGTTDLGVSQL